MFLFWFQGHVLYDRKKVLRNPPRRNFFPLPKTPIFYWNSVGRHKKNVFQNIGSRGRIWIILVLFHYVFDCAEPELGTFNIPRGSLFGHIQDGRHFRYTNDMHVCAMLQSEWYLCQCIYHLEKTHLRLRNTSKLSSAIFQYDCQYFQHRNALFTITSSFIGSISSHIQAGTLWCWQ